MLHTAYYFYYIIVCTLFAFEIYVTSFHALELIQVSKRPKSNRSVQLLSVLELSQAPIRTDPQLQAATEDLGLECWKTRFSTHFFEKKCRTMNFTCATKFKLCKFQSCNCQTSEPAGEWKQNPCLKRTNTSFGAATGTGCILKVIVLLLLSAMLSRVHALVPRAFASERTYRTHICNDGRPECIRCFCTRRKQSLSSEEQTNSSSSSSPSPTTMTEEVSLYRSEGLFSVIKPLDWTSSNVVSFIRKMLEREARERGAKVVKATSRKNKSRILKVGHGGTLDPLATGVLVIGVGKGTKELQRCA